MIILFFYFLFFLIMSALLFGSKDTSSYTSSAYTDNWAMWNSSSITWLIGIIIIAMVCVRFFKSKVLKNTETPKLVVTKIDLDKDNNDCVKIIARKGGIWNFILAKLSIENQYTFLVQKKEQKIMLEEKGMNGTHITNINFDVLTSVKTSFSIPATTCMVLFVISILLLISTIVFGIILGIITVLYFIFGKRIQIQFTNKGGTSLTLNYSPSMIEWVGLSLNEAKEIESTISELRNQHAQPRK